MNKQTEMVQFTIHTSNKNGFPTWDSPLIFNHEVENFDTKDLQFYLYIGQHLNFDHVISDDGKLNPDDAEAWENKYEQAPTGRSYDGFLQWCKDNDYIDDYKIESYTAN